MSREVREVLRVWRLAERLLEDYHARTVRDRQAEHELAQSIAALYIVHQGLTGDADRSPARIAASQRITERTSRLIAELGAPPPATSEDAAPTAEPEGLPDPYEDRLRNGR